MRVGRALLPLLVVVLSACDAGHRENPGVDNTWPGPELVVVQPGPGQIVTRPYVEPNPVMKAALGATHYRMPKGFFDLRNLAPEAEREGDSIRYRIDGGPLRELRDWSRSVDLGDGAHSAGTHILVACVWNGAANAPYANPESVVVRPFHLASEDGEWDLWKTKGDPPRAPLLETGPAMLVTGPAARVKGTPMLTFAFKGQGFGTRYRLAYRVDAGDWRHATKIEPIALADLKPGAHTVVARLEQAEGKAWELVPRPFFARKAADDDPMPGEFNVVKIEFALAE